MAETKLDKNLRHAGLDPRGKSSRKIEARTSPAKFAPDFGNEAKPRNNLFVNLLDANLRREFACVA